jgi:hypothetical protein
MAKHKPSYKPSIKTRELPPIAHPAKGGVIALMCPFCNPTHPLVPGQANTCGTELKVTAIQAIISARTVRQQGLICFKCREKGKGEMVQYMNGYIHVEECAPDINLLREIPPYSRWAELIYRFPKKIRARIEKVTGIVQIVHELTPEGEETGKIQGYFFSPVKKNRDSTQKA